MKRASILFAVLLVLLGTMLPNPPAAEGWWYGGYYGGCGGWCWPGAVIGGLVLGAAAIVTAPFWALSAPLTYPPPVAYAPPPIYSASATYAPRPVYAPPAYQPAPTYGPPQATAVRREVVYPNGRYVLYGDGVRQPWQWVWVPSTLPPPPPAPPVP